MDDDDILRTPTTCLTIVQFHQKARHFAPAHHSSITVRQVDGLRFDINIGLFTAFRPSEHN